MKDSAWEWVKWSVATVIAGLSMAVGFGAYIQSYVYPRSEAEKLERRVDRIEDRMDKDLSYIRAKLDDILQKLRH